MSLECWKASLDGILDHFGDRVNIPKELFDEFAEALSQAAAMESEASGDLCIPNPMKTELDIANRRHEEQARAAEERERIYQAGVARAFGYSPESVWVSVRNGSLEIEARR